MARVKRGVASRARRKKILKAAKGFQGRAKNCYTASRPKSEKAAQYAYRDRKCRKRDFRSLHIQRINAAVRLHGLIYSKLIHLLRENNIGLNRKTLAEMAIHHPEAFKAIITSLKTTESGMEATS